ncbi:MAG: YaiO family outer membrane beta-barrel protein [Burkholderiaceae bacterium]|jgi:YaiO family outer membrane protein
MFRCSLVRVLKSAFIFGAVCLLSPAAAQTVWPTQVQGQNSLTLGASGGNAPQPYQEGAGARLTLDTALHGFKVRVDAQRQTRFGLTGEFAGLQLTRDLDSTRYVTFGAGGGSSRLYARWNTNGFIFQKWGVGSPHVSGLGITYSAMRDDRSDYSVVAQHIWYANDKVIFEGGLRFGRASPGNIASNQQFLATTLGNPVGRHAVVRFARAHEAYLLLSDQQELAQFSSKQASVTLNQPLTREQMLSLTADRYTNPFYTRNRFDFGWSVRW